jgi:peptide/nickel transport system substrate-binding protein
VNGGRIDTVSDVRAVDASTVRITTKGPDPLLPQKSFVVPILPKALIERIGLQEFVNKPVGTGALKVQDYRRSQQMVLVRHPESWRTTRIEEITVFDLPDTGARVAALRSGEVDVIDFLSRENMATIKADPNLLLVAEDHPSAQSFDLEYGTPPYNDKRVRQALNYAVDKEAILKNLLGGAGNIMDGQLLPKNVNGYNPNLKPFEYDPKKAKELLAAAGYPNGFQTAVEFTTTTSDVRLMAEAIFQYFRDIGVTAELRPVETAVWRTHLYDGASGRAPLFYVPWGGTPAPDAEWILSPYAENSKSNSGYKNPAFFEAFTRSRTELDPAKRMSALQAAAAAMRDDPVALFLVQLVFIWASNKKVKGLNFNAGSYFWFDTAEIV